jgi:hypothetical protein
MNFNFEPYASSSAALNFLIHGSVAGGRACGGEEREERTLTVLTIAIDMF